MAQFPRFIRVSNEAGVGRNPDRRMMVKKGSNDKTVAAVKKIIDSTLAKEKKAKLAQEKEDSKKAVIDKPVDKKSLNQISSSAYPDMYEELDIDLDELGCIMMNVEPIDILSIVPGKYHSDLVEASDDDHMMGAVGEKEAHVTLLYGLLQNGNVWKEYVDKVLDGWKMDNVIIDNVGFFETSDSIAIIAHLALTEELSDGNGRLTLLPHVSTFSDYQPHITLAYISNDANVKDWIKYLGDEYTGKTLKTTGINYGDPVEEVVKNFNPAHDKKGQFGSGKSLKTAAVGDRVEIKAGPNKGEWGIITAADGDDYYVGLYGDTKSDLIFSRKELTVTEKGASKVLEPLDSLNPTGGLFVDYKPSDRAKAPLADNMTTLDKTMGGKPDDSITVYRGAPDNQKEIVPGDFITDMKELAVSYTGDGNVIEKTVRQGDVLDDKNEPLGNEYIYRPNADKEIATTNNSLEHAVHNHEEFTGFRDDLLDVHNTLSEEVNNSITTQQNSLESSVIKIEKQVAALIINKIKTTKNAFDKQSDIISEADKKRTVAELTLILSGYYMILFPIYAKQLMSKRASEFGKQAIFSMSDDINSYIKIIATRTAESHINTIVDDILRAAHEAHDKSLGDLVDKYKADGMTNDAEIFKLAQKKALEGASQYNIIKSITETYDNISKTRAKTIARTETNRAFTQSQFQADRQFLAGAGLQDVAYKKWQTRSGNPCPFCLDLEARGPIPFEKNFQDLGTELTSIFTKKDGTTVIRKMAINYEELTAGNAHVNCACRYVLVIMKNDGSQTEENDFSNLTLNFNTTHDKKGRFSSGVTSVSSAELEAIHQYNSQAYLLINKIARGQDGLRKEDSGYGKTIDIINNIIDRTSIPKSQTVFRGIQRPTGDTLNFKKGQTITDKGFMSTSAEESTASKFGGGMGYIVKIAVKKGAKGLDVDNIEGYTHPYKWKELLLRTGSKLKISNVYEQGKETIIETELM